MPRPRLTDRTRPMTFQIPESVYLKLTLELYSEVENRIPHGAISELFNGLTVDWLRRRGYEI